MWPYTCFFTQRKRRKTSDDKDEEEEEKPAKRKPRIQISLGKNKDDDEENGEKKVIKRRRRRKKDADEDDAADAMASPIPRRKRRKLNNEAEEKASKKAPPPAGSETESEDNQPITAMKAAESKASAEKNQSDNDSDASGEKKHSDSKTNGDSGTIFMDVDYWKQERDKLDGSFMAARALFTRHGPWNLPEVTTERKFRLIAKSALVKMDRHDKYSVFADEVSDSEAPGYSEVISNPMHFRKMREKIEGKEYGAGPKAFKKLYGKDCGFFVQI
jgi:Bromodomain